MKTTKPPLARIALAAGLAKRPVIICLGALSVVVFISFEKLHHRPARELDQSATHSAPSSVQPAAPVPAVSPAPDQAGTHQQGAEREVEISPLAPEAIQAELAALTGQSFAKADWSNSGFYTISSLLQTYYWAMREGNLSRWIECRNPLEMMIWQGQARGRTNDILAEFVASLNEVEGYQIETAVPFQERGCIIVTTKHTMTSGELVVDRFAVLRTGREWKIGGEAGLLKYRHHPGLVSAYDLLHKRSVQQ